MASRTNPQPYTVEVKAQTDKGVLVKIIGMGIETWLPRSRVSFPDKMERGQSVSVIIPSWLMQRAMGVTGGY